ncbi:MAG TPA: hypothetical protein VFV77_06005 [Gammaproteobacteria bacterium]|jgi:hypothetical protein|nr:hypothetical protein [Gammaproteobacteria bacterium]HEU5398814.1 hypothetical protein [Gammaproteobacteria bacterium]HEV2111919.1 hypothetical protein [Gammaproteobacteria bacterium]HEV2333243.1 hypothetical protein [Gammaproteobacteria bacterium]HEV2471113.1 hypothetical protein [Chthonomonadales bacterium]
MKKYAVVLSAAALALALTACGKSEAPESAPAASTAAAAPAASTAAAPAAKTAAAPAASTKK